MNYSWYYTCKRFHRASLDYLHTLQWNANVPKVNNNQSKPIIIL